MKGKYDKTKSYKIASFLSKYESKHRDHRGAARLLNIRRITEITNTRYPANSPFYQRLKCIYGKKKK